MIESWGEKGHVQKTEHASPRDVIVLSGIFYNNIWNIVNEIERNMIWKQVNSILIQL